MSPFKKHLLQALFIGAIFFFLFKNIAAKWGELRGAELTLNFVPLLISFPIFAVSLGFLVAGWRSLVGHFGFRVPYPNAFRIVVQSLLGRYIPGKVWAPAGLVYLGSQWGIPAKEGALCAVLSTCLVIVAGIAFSAVWVIGGMGPGGNRFLVPLLVGALAAIIVLHPKILLGVLNRGLRLLKKEPLDVTYKYGNLLKSFPFFIFFWLGMGGGFVLAVGALVHVNAGDIFPLMSIYSLTYVVGIMAVFSPAGLGVRESLMAFLLVGFFPTPLPSVISIYGRLWATILEGLLFLLVLFIPALPRERDQGPGKAQ